MCKLGRRRHLEQLRCWTAAHAMEIQKTGDEMTGGIAALGLHGTREARAGRDKNCIWFNFSLPRKLQKRKNNGTATWSRLKVDVSCLAHVRRCGGRIWPGTAGSAPARRTAQAWGGALAGSCSPACCSSGQAASASAGGAATAEGMGAGWLEWSEPWSEPPAAVGACTWSASRCAPASAAASSGVACSSRDAARRHPA